MRESFVEGWEGNQCFSLNSQPTALDNPGCIGDVNIYPAMFEITGEIPEPIIDELKGGSVAAEYDKP